MEAFPFTDAEWDSLKPVAEAILDADSVNDDAVAASLRLDMLDLLDGLRERYGDHPVLLETAADYTEDDARRARLYRRAVRIAEANGLPTLSIRLSFAFALMSLGNPTAALGELCACGGEAAGANEAEREDWLQRLGWAAEYAEGDEERVRVYRRAVEVAAAHGLPTIGIRLSLARFLLDAERPAVALEELRAGRGEMAGASEDDRTCWAGLCAEASRGAPGAPPDHRG